MYRDAKANLDERDRAVGAILIGEALIASCERAKAIGAARGPEAWRAIRDAHDEFPEIWSSLDRARGVLAQRGINVIGYDELRPTVRTRLATSDGDGDADAMQLDPAALDDARRAAEELKLAVPGADWAAIDRRTTGLVRAPLIRHERNRLIASGLVGLFLVCALTWVASLVPEDKPDRYAEMRRELAEITVQRRFRIIELQSALSERCDPGQAHELAKQLVMDGRGGDAKQFAASYTARCGVDTAVERWANAPRP
jgi:hypothetical protein